MKKSKDSNIPATKPEDCQSRRDFLSMTATAMGGVGLACIGWPLVDSMNPASDVLALNTIEVDLSKIAVGDAVTVSWQGKPVFIRHRTVEEITEARKVEIHALPDPQADEKRVQKDEWLVVIGICTHLGCVPNGQKPTEARGDHKGWFCPCHGSHYDTSGRVRKGPAPRNLDVPKYSFIDNQRLKIG